jgi:hypothetical protein
MRTSRWKLSCVTDNRQIPIAAFGFVGVRAVKQSIAFPSGGVSGLEEMKNSGIIGTVHARARQ